MVTTTEEKKDGRSEGAAKARELRKIKEAAMTPEELAAKRAATAAKRRATIETKKAIENAETSGDVDMIGDGAATITRQITPLEKARAERARRRAGESPVMVSDGPTSKEAARSSRAATAAVASPDVVDEIRAEMGKTYSLEEIAAALDVTTRTVLTYLKEGELKGRKIGGKWRITVDNLKRFLNGD
jgi:excisionase family DNA binding protein